MKIPEESEFDALKAGLFVPPPPLALPKFFGTALASHTLPTHTELTVFDYAAQGGDSAVLTLFQYLGQFRHSFNDTRIRYYVDGEASASIDYNLYLSIGPGFNGISLKNQSWGTSRVGSPSCCLPTPPT